MKQTKNITQQPNKINFYAKSKTLDRTLQLDLNKKYILPKKCLKQNGIKVVIPKTYD